MGLGRREAEPAEWEKTFVAYADPVYGDVERAGTVREALRSAFGEIAKLPPLPHSRREVQQIARLYPAAEVVLHLGSEAREERVKSGEAERARYVHFAAHGVLNENKPEYSGIVLTLAATAPTPAGESARPSEREKATERSEPVEDGLLQVYEVFNLKLNAELAVLSACETGLGKEVRGEGMVGLTRAFLYAGAEAVAVSLWKVADPATAELMVRFYRHLKAGMKKAEALRQARLEMFGQAQYVHPYYWAAFVLVGKS